MDESKEVSTATAYGVPKWIKKKSIRMKD